MNSSSQYARRILLAVSGLTPQIVTETLHALRTDPTGAWTPSEIHLLTTSEGARRARLLLLSDNPGWFHRWRQEYDVEEIEFSESNIHLLCANDGHPLDDIRTAEDNRAAADQITETIRALTSGADSMLHVSLAGGRKTMGFYAGYALSLFGRPQDRLSHVLVPDGYEFAEDFFYPAKTRRVIRGRDKRPLDAAEAHIELAQIPFVHMREGLPEKLRKGKSSYSGVVAAADAALIPPELEIDQQNRIIRAAGRTFRMRRASLALLSVFARRALEQRGSIAAPGKELDHDPEWAARYTKELRRCGKNVEELSEPTIRGLHHFNGDTFSMQLSRMRRELKDQLGATAAQPYLIEDGASRPRRYRLPLSPSAVRFTTLGKPDK